MDRRHYLALVGGGLTLSTAGCVGGDDDGSGDGGNGGNGSDDGIDDSSGGDGSDDGTDDSSGGDSSDDGTDDSSGGDSSDNGTDDSSGDDNGGNGETDDGTAGDDGSTDGGAGDDSSGDDNGGTNGDDGDDGGSGNGGDGGSDGGGEGQGESMGSVTGNTIEGLAVQNWQTIEEWGAPFYEIEMEVKNIGNEETEVDEYRYELTVYDENDNNISGDSNLNAAPDGVIGPGQVDTVTVRRLVEDSASPADVGRYEIGVDCSGALYSGVYCDV
jgi:hypothetical protein